MLPEYGSAVKMNGLDEAIHLCLTLCIKQALDLLGYCLSDQLFPVTVTQGVILQITFEGTQ